MSESSASAVGPSTDVDHREREWIVERSAADEGRCGKLVARVSSVRADSDLELLNFLSGVLVD